MLVVRNEELIMSKLNPELRAKMSQMLGEYLHGAMFGDGLEHDYIVDGFPEFKGLANMNDRELYDEFEEMVDKEDDMSEEYELWLQAKDDLGLTICEGCKCTISEADIKAYQAEAGSKKTTPRLCSDCAEKEE